MKVWFSMLLLVIACTGLIIWDGVHTDKVFNYLHAETSEIHSTLLTTDVTDEKMKERINSLNDYWTKKMDTLCISISRKDLQPISDYLQYLRSAVINESQEDAITYSALLQYNVEGLREVTGISALNLL